MKPWWRDHWRREARIMALVLFAPVVISLVAGFIVQWLH